MKSNGVRIQIRMTQQEKELLISAAERCGFKSLSEYIRVSAYEKSQRNLKEFGENSPGYYRTPPEPTKLSPTDSTFFVDSILNPKEPNALLKALFSKDNEEILKELLAAQAQNKTR
jgi:uncharacterized protein (DUF1778 family)